MEELTNEQIWEVNCMLAREFIESRLDVKPTLEAIQSFALFIQRFEAEFGAITADKSGTV